MNGAVPQPSAISSGGGGQITREAAWPSRAGLFLAFLVLVPLGLLLSLAGRNLIGRFGGPVTVVLFLSGPPGVVLFALGFRQALSKFRTLRKKLTGWHGLWLLLLVSGFVIRTRDIGAVREGPLDTAAIFRVSLVAITGLVLMVCLALKRPSWLGSLFRGLVGVMAVFALVCVASALWSINPPWTLYKSLEYLVDVALLAAILATVRSVESYETLLDWTWVLCGLLVASAWLEVPIWPEEALEEQLATGVLGFRLAGVFPGLGSNGLGTLGAIVAAIAVCRLLPTAGRKFDRAWYILLLVFGSATMVWTQTRSAMGGFLLGVLLVLFFTQRARLAAALGAASAAVLAFTGAGSALLAFLQRGQSTEGIASLSGRLGWWTAALDALKQHPLTGFGAFAAGFAIWPALGDKGVGPLHSDYVETLVGTSIWGVILIVAGLLGTWWVLIRYLRRFSSPTLERQLAVECVAVLAIITVRSGVMNLMIWHPPLQYFVLLGYAEYLRRRYNRGSRTAPS